MTGGNSARQGGVEVNNGIVRLFVAIALPHEAASELDEVVAPLRPARPDLRWTGRDAWHLTLAFLSEVDGVGHHRVGDTAGTRRPAASVPVPGPGRSGRLPRRQPGPGAVDRHPG